MLFLKIQKNTLRNPSEKGKNQLCDRNIAYTNMSFFMKTKNGHVLTFTDKCIFLPFYVFRHVTDLSHDVVFVGTFLNNYSYCS